MRRIVVEVQNDTDLESVHELVHRIVLSSKYPTRVAKPNSDSEQAMKKLDDLGYWYNTLSKTYVRRNYL